MHTKPNEHLEHQVIHALMQAGHLSSQRIDVIANSGVVTLNGAVQSFRRKLLAGTVASSCSGVESVVNNLKVSPPDVYSDLEIAEQINCVFSDGSNLKDNAIRVGVNQGIVTLTGYVPNTLDKDIAMDIAAGVDGVRDVRNMLVINADRVLSNEEHSVAIGAAMKRVIGMENEEIQVTVVDEKARLSGHVDAPWKRESAERTVRQFGILKVCNDIRVAIGTTANQ